MKVFVLETYLVDKTDHSSITIGGVYTEEALAEIEGQKHLDNYIDNGYFDAVYRVTEQEVISEIEEDLLGKKVIIADSGETYQNIGKHMKYQSNKEWLKRYLPSKGDTGTIIGLESHPDSIDLQINIYIIELDNSGYIFMSRHGFELDK